MDRQGYRAQGGGQRFSGGQRPQDSSPQVSEQELKAIIQDGDSEKLVKLAETLGSSIATQVTTAQIRGIFGSVRRIEMIWPRNADETTRKAAVRQLLLLKPKISYKARQVTGVSSLQRVLAPAIDLVGGERERFINFVDFFEAIVAYHRALGGRD